MSTHPNSLTPEDFSALKRLAHYILNSHLSNIYNIFAYIICITYGITMYGLYLHQTNTFVYPPLLANLPT